VIHYKIREISDVYYKPSLLCIEEKRGFRLQFQFLILFFIFIDIRGAITIVEYTVKVHIFLFYMILLLDVLLLIILRIILGTLLMC
jgi:hypothetical protein